MSAGPGRTVVLVMVDQLAARWLEVARTGIVELPHFDALQREGTTFTRAFSTNPVCSPSRASIITGLSCSAHGVTECGYDLSPEVPNFVAALQRSGWTTGAFGKLHLITQIETLAPDYRVYGFDVVCNTEDARAGEWLEWVEANHPEHYEAALSTVWMTMVPELSTYGAEREDLKAKVLAAQRKFPESTTEAYELPFPADVSQTAWITDRAVDFIESAEGDVFAHVSYVQPHNPFTPPAEYLDRVDVAAIPDPVPAEWQSDPIGYFRQERYTDASYEVEDWRRQRQLYFADLAHLDHELGRIRDALTREGRDDDALIIFTSDHGELLHDHGLLGKWERHYDPCVRVPMIVADTRIDQPAPTSAELVEHTDIAATVHDWADVAEPRLPVLETGGLEPLRMLHGRSLLPLVRQDPDVSWRQEVLIQSNNSHVDATPSSWARTVRTARHRFTRYLAGGGEQLFDLARDPDEQVNLATDPEAADLRNELTQQLLDLCATDAHPNSPRGLFRIGSW